MCKVENTFMFTMERKPTNTGPCVYLISQPNKIRFQIVYTVVVSEFPEALPVCDTEFFIAVVITLDKK